MQQFALKIPPLLLWFIFVGLSYFVAWLLSFARLASPWLYPVAFLCFAFGGLIALAGVLAFRRARTTVNPLTPEKSSAIVTTGIYRKTRNPMYLGMTLAFIGIVVASGNGLGFIFVACFCFALTRLQIEPEERLLQAQFGEEYLHYCQTVRRWF